MRAVVQRVKNCSVTVGDEQVAAIGHGALILLGIAATDTTADCDHLAQKIVRLRYFADAAGKMNCSVADVAGQLLIVSQFTLLGDCRKGRRPSFVRAARPQAAETLYERFVQKVRDTGVPVQTGRFQAMMDVALINDGPVTLIVE